VPFGGSAGVKLDLTQRGSEPMRFALKADLRKAEITIAALGWSKQAGTAGRLEARGVFGKGTAVDKLLIEAEGLRAEGAVDIGPAGNVRSAHLSRVEMPGFLDASVAYSPGDDGVSNIEVSGRLLDISSRFGRRGNKDRPSAPVRMRLDLEQLRVTRNMVISSAGGLIVRRADGGVRGNIKGRLGPAPVTIALDLPARGDGKLTIDSPDAGGALRAAGIYRDARGGKLHVDAVLPAGGNGGLTGRARIDDVIVRSEATFREMLRDGGLSEATAELSGSGIGFREILIPFTYMDGVVTVTDAIAVSSALGLKMTGTLNERTEALDLAGVLSPAYGLTGAFDNIPVIGALLSGGRGEGILAMTFTLKGAMRNPSFSINPLSLLTPGILRNIFSGGGTTPENIDELNELFGGDVDR